MIIITDNTGYADTFLGDQHDWIPWIPGSAGQALGELSNRLFRGSGIFQSVLQTGFPWQYIFVVEHAPESQYDVLIQLRALEIHLPDKVLCVAGSGDRFHGFRNRSWSSQQGNIHLSVFLSPRRRINHFNIGFTILSAVSVVQTVDRIPGLKGKAGTKWVNDIFIEGAKVSGVLTHTQTLQDTVMNAVLGIGLNVETAPGVVSDSFVPKTACLRDFTDDPDCNRGHVLSLLIDTLARNYDILLNNGYPRLLDIYRQRSVIIGKECVIHEDTPQPDPAVIARGKITGIGDNLELFLEGTHTPVIKGRLILDPSGQNDTNHAPQA